MDHLFITSVTFDPTGTSKENRPLESVFIRNLGFSSIRSSASSIGPAVFSIYFSCALRRRATDVQLVTKSCAKPSTRAEAASRRKQNENRHASERICMGPARDTGHYSQMNEAHA